MKDAWMVKGEFTPVVVALMFLSVTTVSERQKKALALFEFSLSFGFLKGEKKGDVSLFIDIFTLDSLTTALASCLFAVMSFLVCGKLQF